jgi:hypothetical protein
MGFARRVVRKSLRRATPRPLRKAMHLARTARNAVTPRPVKQVSRASYTVRHLVGATENAVIGAALYPPRTRRRRRGFWSWLTGRSQSQPRKPERSAPAPTRWPYVDPSGGVRRSNLPQQAPAPGQAQATAQQASMRQAPVKQSRQRRVEPWPARQAFRTQPPPSAGLTGGKGIPDTIAAHPCVLRTWRAAAR